MEGTYEIMVEMEKKMIFLDDVTHNMLMRGFCWLGQLDEARRLIDEMKRMGIHPDFVIHNMLISGYSMKGGWSNVIVDSTVTHFYGALEVAYKRNGVPALLAEVKKATPSRGVLMEDFNTVEIVQPYEKNGAVCLSILTDKRYFQGSFENLEKICEELRITTLIEVHDGREMERVLNINGVKLTGINNRSLETFVLYTSNTKMLLKRHGNNIREKGILVVDESGLFTLEDVAYVQNAGQVCNTTSCLLLHKEIAKQFLDRLVGWAKNMKVSDPVENGCTLGSVVSEEQCEKIKKLISVVRSKGATILYGDGRPHHLIRGLFLAHTIITAVSTSMQIGQEEVFGLVIHVKEYKTESEVVELANGTYFGLADDVIFHDQERCDGIGVLDLQWDPGGNIAMYRLDGKPILREEC
jgi:pentatricopeptide repeat protein